MATPGISELEAIGAIIRSIWQPETEYFFRGRFYLKIPTGQDGLRFLQTNRMLEELGWEARWAGPAARPFLLVRKKEKDFFPVLPTALFVGTVLSMIFFPPFLQYGFSIFQNFEPVWQDLPFATGLLAILVFHESGHFFAAKRLGVEVSFPYFIPGPTLFGTFGAVIRANAPFFNRRDLMEIAAAGPIAGLIVAIPVLIHGLATSQPVPITGDGLILGDSLLTWGLTKILWPNLPEGYTLAISPLGFAGWAGLLVTMLNLLPIGSLDGGHIAYALFGKNQKWVARVFWVALIPLGIWFTGWWMWAVLAIFFRLEHGPTLDDEYSLTPFHKFLGWLNLVIFVFIFIPVPLA